MYHHALKSVNVSYKYQLKRVKSCFCRNTLCAIESLGVHNIRLKFMTQIAELLLQGLVGDKYQLPSTVAGKPSYWKPKCYSSLNQVGKNILKNVNIAKGLRPGKY